MVFIKDQDYQYYHKYRYMMDHPLVSLEVVDDLGGFINLIHQIMEYRHIEVVTSHFLQHPIYIEYDGLGGFIVWFWALDDEIKRINDRAEIGVNYTFTSLEAAATAIFTLLTKGSYEPLISNV